MPSYLERDQLKSVSPYVTDTDAILRNFQTKLNYWGQGAAQVKSAYERYANLELTRDDNKEGLSEFMKGAKEQVKNAANTDLSVGDNIVNAQEIFKPLLGPEFRNIMGDNALTKFFNSQYSIANVYKNKDGGKEYSDTNLRDIQQQHADFKNAKDPGSWEEFMGKRREYTPYIDVKGKVQKLMTDFYENDNQIGGTSITSIGQNPMYLLKEENKSVKAERLKRYINENLSDKDKNQLAIESRVNLHDLISVYGEPTVSEEYWNKNIDNTKNLRDAYAVELGSINDKIKMLSGRTLTDSEEALLKDDKVRKGLIEKTISKIDKTIEGYSDPNAFSEFRKNLEGNVRSLYIDDFTTGLSNAYSKTDYTQSISQNTAYFSALAQSLNENKLREEIRANKASELLDAAALRINEYVAQTGRINALKPATGGRKTKEDVTNPDGSPVDPNLVLTAIGPDSDVDTPDEDKKPYDVLKDKQAAVLTSMEENIKPLKAKILSIEGDIHDYASWESYFKDNASKLTTLKLSDMPDHLKNAAVAFLINSGKYPNGVPNALNIGDVKKQFDEYTQKVFMTHAKEGTDAVYHGLKLGEMVKNQNRFLKEKETYDNIEKELLSFIKTTQGTTAVDNNPGTPLEALSDYITAMRIYPSVIFGKKTAAEASAELVKKTKVNQGKNIDEINDYLSKNYPILKRAIVGSITGIRLDTDDGSAYARGIGLDLANKILNSGKGDSFGGNVLEINVSDKDGAVVKMSAESRGILRNIRWDDQKSPVTELKFVKKGDGTGYWQGTFATGNTEKDKFINFKIKSPIPSYLNDPIADYVTKNAKTYSTLIGERGNKFEVRGLQNSNSDINYGYTVTTTILTKSIDKDVFGDPYVVFNTSTETEEVPPTKNLSDIEDAFIKKANYSNKLYNAFEAFRAVHKRSPTEKEFQEEIKKIK